MVIMSALAPHRLLVSKTAAGGGAPSVPLSMSDPEASMGSGVLPSVVPCAEEATDVEDAMNAVLLAQLADAGEEDMQCVDAAAAACVSSFFYWAGERVGLSVGGKEGREECAIAGMGGGGVGGFGRAQMAGPPVRGGIKNPPPHVTHARLHPDEELRCVLAVVRHGDRTPKQKMKVKVTQVSGVGRVWGEGFGQAGDQGLCLARAMICQARGAWTDGNGGVLTSLSPPLPPPSSPLPPCRGSRSCWRCAASTWTPRASKPSSRCRGICIYLAGV